MAISVIKGLPPATETTMTNDTTYVTGGTSYLRKKLGICALSLAVKVSPFPSANTTYTIGTVPDSYKPKRTVSFVAQSINSALTFLGQVGTNGEVSLASMGQVNTAGWINGSATWIVE